MELEEILESDLRKMQFNCIMVAVETGKNDVTGEEICSEICGNLSQYYQTQKFWGPFLWKRMYTALCLEKKKISL